MSLFLVGGRTPWRELRHARPLSAAGLLSQFGDAEL